MADSLPEGIIAAACTPLAADGTPNPERLAEHVRHLREHGCDYVLLFGTTGEGLSFTAEERRTTLEQVLERDIDAGDLLVGTGAAPLPDAIALTEHATAAGVAGVLVPPPFHIPVVSDDAVFATYDHLIRRVDDERLRVFLYHFPALTGVKISFPVIQRLIDAHGPQIAGVKDSSQEWDHMQALCSSFPDLHIFAGTERYLSNILAEGGAGCISATVNVTAPLARRVYDAATGDTDRATVAELQDRLTGFRTDIVLHPAITALKTLLAMQTGDETWANTRLPVLPPDETLRSNLRDLHQRLSGL
jgi:4-hydroxy-tetrahydrodipicolinate synthase